MVLSLFSHFKCDRRRISPPGFRNDQEINAAGWIVYDALYVYCEEMIRRGKPDGAFK
jgi:hypothetical protein